MKGYICLDFRSSDDVADQMSNLLNDKVFLQPVGSEMNLLRLQRDELNKLKDGDVKQLADEVDQLNNGYKDLIRSAAPGVSTADIVSQKIQVRLYDFSRKTN